MHYTIINEVGRLTLFYYYLTAKGTFSVATNDAMKFGTKKDAMEYARRIITVREGATELIAEHVRTRLFVRGPRKGMYKV